jgi:hypothetical protein
LIAHAVGGELPYNYIWSNGSITQTMSDVSGTYSLTVIDFTGQQVTASDSIPVCIGGILYVKCLLQGFYKEGGLMHPVLNQSGIVSPLTFTDSVSIELRQTTSGFPVTSSFKGILHSDGLINCHIPLSEFGSLRYIVVKHRNSIETWSANPVSITNQMLYNFTISNTQAYAENMVQVESNIWAMHSGDINQDENIDLLDNAISETDINNFEFGYFPTDINGDGNVDLLDNVVLESNISNFIFSQHP